MKRTFIYSIAILYAAISLLLAQNTNQTIDKPELNLSISDGYELFIGWPMVIEVNVYHSEFASNSTAFNITAKADDWTDRFKLLVKDSTGKAIIWPFELSPAGAKELLLDSNTIAGVVWVLSPENCINLKEGIYKISAILDTSDAASINSWKGKVSSEEISINIKAEPTTLNSQVKKLKSISLLKYYIAKKDNKNALMILDETLKNNPNDIRALAVKGYVLNELGEQVEAIKIINKALDLFFASHSETEPPIFLIDIQRNIFKTAIKLSDEPVEVEEPPIE